MSDVLSYSVQSDETVALQLPSVLRQHQFQEQQLLEQQQQQQQQHNALQQQDHFSDSQRLSSSLDLSPDRDRRDTLTLRASDETPERHPSSRQEFSSVGNVIGVYADPTAVTDDWGDDFELDDASNEEHASATTPTVDDSSSPFPGWLDEPLFQSQTSKVDEELLTSTRIPDSFATATLVPTAQQSTASANNKPVELLSWADDPQPIRPLQPGSFVTPKITHSSLLMYPSVGYQASTVHPSFAKVRDFFASHGSIIRKHFDALVRESAGSIKFDELCRKTYMLYGDVDVSALTQANFTLAADVLLWKLEWANINNNREDRARLILSLSKLYKHIGNFQQAMRIVRDALKIIIPIDDSVVALALAIELEYESAILHRYVGSLAESGRSLMRAMTHSASLANYDKDDPKFPAPSQRGLWWQLRCKYLRAELAFDLDELDTAVQFYSEYVNESLSRMIGTMTPPSVECGSIGPEYMRYCLFSPRRLVLALWTTVLCFGNMRCFPAAADVANLTSIVANAFGYEDANEAASNVRSRLKDISAELKLQYDQIQRTGPQRITSDTDELHLSSTSNAQFDYDVGNFGDVGVNDEVEDWDTQLAQELNISIVRCCDMDAEQVDDDGFDSAIVDGFDNGDLQTNTTDLFASNNLQQESSFAEKSTSSRFFATRQSDNSVHGTKTPDARLLSGTNDGHLIEAELRQYLNRVSNSGSSLPARLMYPKPTEPFIGPLKGPKEHELFLHTFVRSKDPEWYRRSTQGLQALPQWYPSAACKLNFNIDPIQVMDDFNPDEHVLSIGWGMHLLDAVWKVVRSQVELSTKHRRLESLVDKVFKKIANISTEFPASIDSDRHVRLEVLGILLDALRLVREVVTDSGREAIWFSEACDALSTAAAILTPAAKAAVELFQAESRAHCGITAVVPSRLIDRCANLSRHHFDNNGSNMFSSDEAERKRTNSDEVGVPSHLRHSVIDLMHALYWKTKAGFDASSRSNSLEQLLHADVASSLFLIGSGISPVDGTKIDLSKEVRLLRIPKRRKTKSVDSEMVVDETRRVSSLELVRDLKSLWSFLPLSAGVVRAKVSFALAHHTRVSEQNYSHAERFLFDALMSIHHVTGAQMFPDSFFSPVIRVAPVSVVSSLLSDAILSTYGNLTSSHAKYRYGVAALEAGCDGARVRNKSKQSYRGAVFDVVNLALDNNDWRRALTLLYNMRSLIHPNDGLRNEFIHLCVLVHNICRDAGCLPASVVPLHAFSVVIYEERLQMLLQRFKRRLAKKKRNRIRRYISGTPLPKYLPISTALTNRRNALASFFEVPIVSAAVDNTFRSSSSFMNLKPRQTTSALSRKSDGSRRTPSNSAVRLLTLLWPLHAILFRRSSGSLGGTKSSSNTPTALSDELDESDEQMPAFHKHMEETPRFHSAPEGSSANHPTVDHSAGHQSAANHSAHYSAHEAQISPAQEAEFEQERRELLRIEAEQERKADSDRCRVELMRIETEYALGDFANADQRCHALLDMSQAPEVRFKVYEVMSLILLKKRQINRCLDVIDTFEDEYVRNDNDFGHNQRSQDDTNRMSFFRQQDMDGSRDENSPLFIPVVTALRLRALTHGGRLEEALNIADKALEVCPESSFWDCGRLHYLRAKVLYAMSCTSSPVFRREAEGSTGEFSEETEVILKMTELTMEAFETSSHYFEVSGDELSAAKSDLKWARTCIDFLFRRVVLSYESGGGVPLNIACKVLERQISISEVQQVVYNVLSVFWTANDPVLLMDAMAALAEVKCISGHAAPSWMYWVLEAWKLFSKLFTNTEDLTVILSEMAPVSILMRLRNLCGRLVRLVMCNDALINMRDMTKHLRLFEVYVKLNLCIDQKMNLTSNAHRDSSEGPSSSSSSTSASIPEQQAHVSTGDVRFVDTEDNGTISRALSQTVTQKDASSQPLMISSKSALKRSILKATRSFDRKNKISQDLPDTPTPVGYSVSSEGFAVAGISDEVNEERVENDGERREVLSETSKSIKSKPNSTPSSKPRPKIKPWGKGRTKSKLKSRSKSNSTSALHDGEEAKRNELSFLLDIISEETQRGAVKTNGVSSIYGETIASRVWAHMHRVKTQCKRFMHGEISMSQLQERNHEAVLSWMHCIPVSRKEWNVPESIRRRLVYILYAHGVVGYFAVDRGGSVARVAFGGKLGTLRDDSLEVAVENDEPNINESRSVATLINSNTTATTTTQTRFNNLNNLNHNLATSNSNSIGSKPPLMPPMPPVAAPTPLGPPINVPEIPSTSRNMHSEQKQNHAPVGIRSPTDLERKYLSELVRGFKSGHVWHKNRDWEIVNGLATQVLKAPRSLLTTSPMQKFRSRPIVLVADLALQIIPWELFFDHVVIRSHSLLDVIRTAQVETHDHSHYMTNNISASNFGRSRISVMPSSMSMTEIASEARHPSGNPITRSGSSILKDSIRLNKSNSIYQIGSSTNQTYQRSAAETSTTNPTIDIIPSPTGVTSGTNAAAATATATATSFIPTKRVVQFLNFVPSRKEAVDLERTEEARRQQLAFHGLLRLNQLHATGLVSFLDLGGFSDTTAVNAVARPTGPLSSPLSQSRKGLHLFGLRIAGNIGKRNFPHIEFIKVSGLGSATTRDLKEAVMITTSNINNNNNHHIKPTHIQPNGVKKTDSILPSNRGNVAPSQIIRQRSKPHVHHHPNIRSSSRARIQSDLTRNTALPNTSNRLGFPDKVNTNSGDVTLATGTLNGNMGIPSDLGAFISVFMFSYADLVDCSESVFGLRREIGNAILMFAPAIHMKVLAMHLQDEELMVEIERVCGRWLQQQSHQGAISVVSSDDIAAVARVVIEHVSRFSREKRIPIVVFLGDSFLGEGLKDVFSNHPIHNRHHHHHRHRHPHQNRHHKPRIRLKYK